LAGTKRVGVIFGSLGRHDRIASWRIGRAPLDCQRRGYRSV
jgi:hypothetical protein